MGIRCARIILRLHRGVIDAHQAVCLSLSQRMKRKHQGSEEAYSCNIGVLMTSILLHDISLHAFSNWEPCY